MIKGRPILFIATTILLLWMLSTNDDASALSCDVSPDPWFSYQINFDKDTLPAGVQFITKNEYITGKGSVYEKFSLKNNGSTPLYLTEVPDNSKPIYSYPNSELPTGEIPRHKLVDGKAYYWARFQPNLNTYIQNAGGVDNSATYQLNIDQEELSKLGVEIVNVYEDDRPASTQPPATQEFSITAYYGSQPVNIKGDIHYALNGSYDPKASVKKIESCNKTLKKWEGQQKIFGIFPFLKTASLLSLPILVSFLAYRLIKKKPTRNLLVIIIFVVLFNLAIQLFTSVYF